MKVGVLAVQGDFDAHRKRLEELGAEVVLVRKPEQLDGIDGLVIPGGESGAFLRILGEKGVEKLKEFVRLKPTFGTCAGAILLASRVKNPAQNSLGLLDMTVLRNGYGRQLASDVAFGKSKLETKPMEMVFIRAPIIEHVGEGIEVLAEYGGKPTLVQRDNVLAATFHPELTDDSTVHRHFLGLIKKTAAVPEALSAETRK